MTEDPEYDTDFRAHPEEYEIGRGEEGVLQPPFATLARRPRRLARWQKRGALPLVALAPARSFHSLAVEAGDEPWRGSEQ
ncbi:hypothetical protein [Halococcus agarilyticus]|uniref:hypothetical protein n=1 Tax=Halococcus agarilyticus TaxID=1232219 RepID=UPI000A5F0B38|nr:hypothetical protein [Halococcus agarilyticus]